MQSNYHGAGAVDATPISTTVLSRDELDFARLRFERLRAGLVALSRILPRFEQVLHHGHLTSPALPTFPAIAELGDLADLKEETLQTYESMVRKDREYERRVQGIVNSF